MFFVFIMYNCQLWRQRNVGVAIPNNPDLDLIMMKQCLEKASEVGCLKLGAEAYV
jgi:hypothetical protein